ncbi:MAG: tagaturonate reductase [Clostridia bacterium]|nr:tagaturonate reductase [Clostridia bacterium]
MNTINHTYSKKHRPERIIQFGEGGFLRGFADWMIQQMNDKGFTNAGIVVVQPIKDGLCKKLSEQDCMYTHIMRGVEGVEVTVVDSITRCVEPYENYNEYLKLAENPDFRFIISNTTESGITYTAGDSLTDTPPVSFPGKVTALLYKRFELGLDGFVFLPCELIDKNGEMLKNIILRYAEEWGLGTDFIDWISNKNTFCNTLVDRINTGYPKNEKINLEYEDSMINTSEFFHLWVIEGPSEALQELPFEKAGLNVIICNNLEMYRTRKVRILNGAHTAFVPYGLLEGFDTVKSCIDNGKMLSFIKNCIYDEIIPTLDLPEKELKDYANSVIERFSNPYIEHFLQSIALNSISKFKVRVLPSILEYIKRYSKIPENLVFSFAKLIEFYKTGTPDDDAKIIDFIKNNSIEKILANKAFWDSNLSFLSEEVKKYDNK